MGLGYGSYFRHREGTSYQIYRGGLPSPYRGAAIKAYTQSFGEALSHELKGKGVDVLCAAPGPVDSGFAAEVD